MNLQRWFEIWFSDSKYGPINPSITGSFTWKDLSFFLAPQPLQIIEGVYVTIGNPAFCLFLYLTGIHFWGKLQHGGDVKKSSVDQSELEKWVLSHCQTYYMHTGAKPYRNMACCGCWWLGWQCFTNFSWFPYGSPMIPPCFPYDSQVLLWVLGWFPVGSPRFPF